MGSLIQDVRYALRTLRRSPGLVAVVVLSLVAGEPSEPGGGDARRGLTSPLAGP